MGLLEAQPQAASAPVYLSELCWRKEEIHARPVGAAIYAPRHQEQIRRLGTARAHRRTAKARNPQAHDSMVT